MKLCRFFSALVLTGAMLVPLQAQERYSDTSGDVQFIAARDAFRQGNRTRLEALAGQMRGYVLADYADYYLLRSGLDQQDPAAVMAFVDRLEGSYLSEKLRSEWLRALAKYGDWSGVEQQFARLRAPDQEARCLALQARLVRQDASALVEGEALWLSLTDVPESCQPLLDMVGFRVSSDQIWARVHLLFEVNKLGQARQVWQSLPASLQPDARQLDQMQDKPAAWLAKLPVGSLDSRVGREMVALAIQRLSRNDPRFAAEQLSRFSAQLGDMERAWAWGQVGLQAAKRHMPEALDWYLRSQPGSLSAEGAEWQVRAALRAQEWGAVRNAIEGMPPALREKPEWVYWLGRAYKAGGRGDEANRLFQQVAGQVNFYGNLADEELGRSINVASRSRPVTADELALAQANPGLARALALFRLDLRTEAIREWNWAIREMSDRQLLATAEMARRQQIYDRAINTADKTRSEHDFTLRYLAPYDDQVRPAARDQALDDAWVYGLMRQESRFITNAKSTVGASGLMQLMPATAKWVAKKIGLKDYDHRRVNDTDMNLLLGTTYMRMVMENLDNHPVLASAAYNAGPGRARKWRAEIPLEGAIYAETIPFNETRDYVKKVMSNAVYYSVLFNGQPASLRSRLGTVPPRGSDGTPKVEDLP